ncbi:IS200/IS605 family transposase [uncultured Ruegeria sp.]|uniref:IS200/IS605 family transposase n=1 Tax=uncultured Ruegeria sp. TaxID=259304 RepID=UPI00262B4151|nr:IS200/IS605 family transposase [uncultured Ruegeria sp.]
MDQARNRTRTEQVYSCLDCSALRTAISRALDQVPNWWKLGNSRGVRLRVRAIIRQVGHENEVDILRGVLSSDHVHVFVSVPPKIAISDLVRKMKGRSSHKVQREFPALRRRYWGRRFWGRGYFSTTNGAITEDIVLQYLENHIADPTDASR